MMAVVAARELADGEVVFVGIGLPNLACNLARRTHAPRLVLIYESGAVGATPSRLPVSIGDPALVTGSLMVWGWRTYSSCFCRTDASRSAFFAERRWIATATSHHRHRAVRGPKVRLPGSGGAAEIAIHAHRILIISKLSPARSRAGRLRDQSGQRVAKVITDKGVLERDEASGDLVLAGLYPGSRRRK